MIERYVTQKGHKQAMDTPTIIRYYKEIDPVKRKTLLEKSIQEGQTPEEDAIRMQLWEIRYKEYSDADKNRRADGYLALWMILEFNRKSAGGFFGSRSARKEITNHLRKLRFSEIQEKSPLHKELLYRECCHMVRTYMELCKEDKSYNSVAFGIMSMSSEQREEKLRHDIRETAFELPVAIKMEQELDIVIRAAKEVYEEYFLEEDEI